MLNGVAHEFVHAFVGHEDTIDNFHPEKQQGQAYFEQEHHHCDFLHLPSPVYLSSSFQLYFYPALEHIETFLLEDIAVFSRPHFHTALRGPPSIG